MEDNGDFKSLRKDKINFIRNIFYGFGHRILEKCFYRTLPVGCLWSQQRAFHYNQLIILRGKKHLQIKLQRFRKVSIMTFEQLVHQSNSLYKVLKMKLNFHKKKVVTSKSPFFVIGPFLTPHSICLNIGFWQSSFAWKCCVVNLSTFN